MNNLVATILEPEPAVALGPHIRLCTNLQLLSVTDVTTGLYDLPDEQIVQQCKPQTLDGGFYVFSHAHVQQLGSQTG